MALPPEPIEEVLPDAALVVEAEVAEVLSTGPLQPRTETLPGATSTGRKVAEQTVRLKVTRAHKGATPLGEVVATKPAGAYALRAGNKGPFLLDGTKPNPVILGRYGPDTWSLDRVLSALKAAG